MTVTLEDLRYPVGPVPPFAPMTAADRAAAIDEIAALPARMRAAVAGLTDAQLDTPYRPGGWTIRQVVHHVPDSHLNAYIRVKLALTEDVPTIKPYDEAKWAELADSRMPIEVSLRLLESVHERWVALLRPMGPNELARTFIHPEYPDGPRTLEWVIHVYAWHSRHHLAHITGLRQRQGW